LPDGGRVRPDEDDSNNPYKAQTKANTNPAWLHPDDARPLNVDLHGLGDYAQNLGNLRDNLMDSIGYLRVLGTMPAQAWENGALPEGVHTMQLMVANYNELSRYLAYLVQALSNVGSAAQTIAVSYAGTDGWSAADLNSVQFAYGQPVRQPTGYPEG